MRPAVCKPLLAAVVVAPGAFEYLERVVEHEFDETDRILGDGFGVSETVDACALFVAGFGLADSLGTFPVALADQPEMNQSLLDR